MKNILVTGAGGLIGSHLIPALAKNHKVFTVSTSQNFAYNFPIDFAKEWNTSQLPTNLDTIVHLAQSEHFKDFPNSAVDVFNTNTTSTLKLLDHACKTGVKNFVFASSGGVYGNSDEALSEEQQIVYKGSYGFYIASKHCAEVILDNYSQLLNIIQLRIFFVYGKGQRKDMLIPRLITNVQEGKPINLQGEEGLKINPTHVSDAVNAIQAAMELEGSHKINVAGPEVLSLKQIAETIGRVTGSAPHFTFEEKKANHLIGSIDKMKKLLGEPIVSFKEGIKQVIHS